MATDYMVANLDAAYIRISRDLRAYYKPGHFVRSHWYLRVSNHGASLVVPYKVKDEHTGEWSGTNEYMEAL